MNEQTQMWTVYNLIHILYRLKIKKKYPHDNSVIRYVYRRRGYSVEAKDEQL